MYTLRPWQTTKCSAAVNVAKTSYLWGTRDNKEKLQTFSTFNFIIIVFSRETKVQ